MSRIEEEAHEAAFGANAEKYRLQEDSVIGDPHRRDPDVVGPLESRHVKNGAPEFKDGIVEIGALLRTQGRFIAEQTKFLTRRTGSPEQEVQAQAIYCAALYELVAAQAAVLRQLNVL